MQLRSHLDYHNMKGKTKRNKWKRCISYLFVHIELTSKVQRSSVSHHMHIFPNKINDNLRTVA